MIPEECFEKYTTEALQELFVQYAWEKKPLKEKVKILKTRLMGFLMEEREIKNQMVSDPDAIWFLKMWLEEVAEEKLVVEKEIAYYIWEANPDKSGELNIELAKSRLITDFLQFNRAGFTKCLWHQDAHPSLRYHKKRNKVHCFSCGADHDVIDVVMALNGWKLPEAVKFLTNT